MARGVNKVILIGNLGNDPEVRHTTNGSTVANISLATTDIWKDKQSGEAQERTEWHRVVFFTRLAEIVAQYLHKGSKIYIEGSLRTRKWQDQNGVERYTTEIIADEMQMLDSKGGGGAQDKHKDNMQPLGQRADIKVQPSRNVEPLVGTTPEDTMLAVDDDIPF